MRALSGKNEGLRPKRVLGVAAHPDDLDYGAGGTMALFAWQGAAVHYLILTDGSRGSGDRAMMPARLAQMRRDEQRAAGMALGVANISFCNYQDSALVNDEQVRRDIVRAIRRVRPDVVVTTDPTVVYAANRGCITHPDHRAAGQATLDATYPLARDHLSFPELLREGLAPHKVGTVLLINMDTHNFVVDVTSEFERKLSAVAAHTSQFSDMPKVAADLRTQAAQLGKEAGCQYAEAFVRIDVA